MISQDPARKQRRMPWRMLAVAATGALALFGILDFTRDLPPITTDSDFAVTELYTELATRGQLLAGPYSRFGWNHPGPLYFYLQAPLYMLGGHKAATLYAGALVINLAALLTIAWVMARANRGALLVLVTGACVLFAWRVPRFLASPWTGHVPILAAMAFLVICAAVLSGRRRLLPLALIFGTLAVQTSLALVPLVAALAVAVLASLVTTRREGPPVRPLLNATAWIALVLWLLPISEAVSHGGGNLAALWRFFVSDAGAGQTLRNAFVHWSYGLAGVLRPDLGLPWGGHIALTHLSWAIPCAVAQLVLLPLVARRDFTAGRAFDGYLAMSLMLASAIGLWALTRIREDILDHEIFWLSALGALNLAVIAAAVVRAIPLRQMRPETTRALAAGGCIMVLLAGAAIGVNHLRDLAAYELRRTERAVILRSYRAVRAYLRDQAIQKPMIRIDGPMWSEAAGVLLRLYQDGIPFSVAPASAGIFTDAFAPAGDEDALITIGPRELHQEMLARPFSTALHETHPLYVDAIRMMPAPAR